MKFRKFAKQMDCDGTIYSHDDDRWLASADVYAKIPPLISSVTANNEVEEMPVEVAGIAYKVGNCMEAYLADAIMPEADGAIKDCLRVYRATSDRNISVPITNDAWGLIEKGDMPEILVRYDEDLNPEPVALLIKRPRLLADDDAEVVGIIFPVEN